MTPQSQAELLFEEFADISDADGDPIKIVERLAESDTKGTKLPYLVVDDMTFTNVLLFELDDDSVFVVGMMNEDGEDMLSCTAITGPFTIERPSLH